MTVTLGIIAYNEEKFIDNILSDVISQDYPHDMIEIILVDAVSGDATAERMKDFACKYEKDFMAVKICSNPKRIQAAGWNVVLENADGDVIVRVDAHAKIPPDFISANVNVLKSGEMISGGPRPNISLQDTPFANMLLVAESSMFGSSVSASRRFGGKEDKKYVSSLFHAAYRREVFDAVGGFNESLGRTEDNEIHYRMRLAGYRFCLSGTIHSYQYIRGTLGEMLKQKFHNGLWIGLTFKICPKCLRLYHFVPAAFVLALIFGLILMLVGIFTGFKLLVYPLLLLASLYILTDLFMSVSSFIEVPKKHIVLFMLPVVFFLLHVSYGLGTICGLFKPKPRQTQTEPRSGRNE